MELKSALIGAIGGTAATLGLLYAWKQAQAQQDTTHFGSIGGAHAIPVTGGSVVHVGSNLLELIPEQILKNRFGKKASKIVIVSDETVFSFHGQRLVDAFARANVSQAPGKKQLIVHLIKPGEKSKSRAVKETVEDDLIEKGCKRDTVMVALGGGVVGDLTGFVAATFMRGVPVVQIPTSVMAMVDSSVGGKTAVNIPAGKNLVGAFHQPFRVFADMDLLSTLGHREIEEGLAEAVKMGVIRSAPLFDMMEEKVKDVLALERTALAEVVFEAVRMKAEVVAIDEKEAGLRAILNFGHTIGHAIEGLVSPQMLHGECVAVGMVLEAELAEKMGKITNEQCARIKACLETYHLPVTIDKKYGLKLEDIMKKMKVDKKNVGDSIRCTIITGIGTCIPDAIPVDKDLVRQVVAAHL